MGDRAPSVARNRKYVDGIKAWGECLDCGYNYPACAMDFDHAYPSDPTYGENRYTYIVANKRIDVFIVAGTSVAA